MNTLDIARYIVRTYKQCSMGYNYTDDGLVELNTYTEDTLVDECLSFFSNDKIGMCGCGVSEDTDEVIRKLLTIRKEKYEDKISYEESIKRYESDLNIDMDDNNHYGLWQFMMYVLDNAGILEHGSGIGGSWLTKEGKMYLYLLDRRIELEERE